jgi:uncharacterized protein
MSRLLFLVAIAALVYLLLKSYRRPPRKHHTPEVTEDMVRCAQCGVHLPKGESLLAGGKYYCSESHRRAHGTAG